MQRREFLTLIGGGAAAWPLAVLAQQPATPVASATTWELVGVFEMGAALGYRCLTKVAGDLAFIGIDGVLPFSTGRSQDRAAVARISITQNITNAMNTVLGNLDAQRDWGHAKDFVRAMHAIVRANEPGDWVIATGQRHSVREFVELAFGWAGKTALALLLWPTRTAFGPKLPSTGVAGEGSF